MPSIKVYKMDGTEAGTLDLSEKVFGAEYREELIHQAVVTRLANERQGTKSTLTRTEVRGGGRKPWRQKGTGNARQGSIRAPQYRGGGTVFGPTPRSYAYKINRKVRRLALKSALSEKMLENALQVMDKIELATPKTKDFVQIVEAIQAPHKTLFVVSENEDNTNAYLSSRNIPGVSMMSSSAINVYDLVNANRLVMTEAAVKEVEEALS